MSDDPASKDGLRWEIRRRLIERLRIPWEGMGDMANQQRAEAAVQISTMMDEIERLREERDEARRELCAARRELCRDEAIIRLQRQRVHRDSEDVVGLAKEIAVERGWDCFKENTNV